jgi:hypothetical protein
MQHRQEAEVAAAEERERAVRLVMAELAAARAEVEAAAVADAARAAAAELKALRASSIGSSVSADDDRDKSSSWQGRQRGSRRCSGLTALKAVQDAVLTALKAV